MSFGGRTAEGPEEVWMRRALALAARGLGRTRPNPAVGAVIVKEGQVVGEGFHRRAGEPHAEVLALEEAGERARGAEMYVVLEPCNHEGKTPPCTEAILAAGISRVVVAVRDPNPQVPGGGIERLAGAGVEVTLGVLAEEAEALLRAYLHWCRTGLPFVVVKLASSLDGRVGLPGRRVQLSSTASRELVHGLRAELGAVAVGAGTALVDDPLLTVRLPEFDGPQPIRVLVDATGRVPAHLRLFGPEAPTFVVTTEKAAHRMREWEEKGARVLVLPASGRGVDLKALLEALGREGLQGLLVEGGPELATSFLEEGLAQEVVLVVAPTVLGPEGLPLATRPWPGLRLVQSEAVGEDLWLRLLPLKRAAEGACSQVSSRSWGE